MSVFDHPLHRLPKYGDGIGLHRVQFLMEVCGIDGDDVARRSVAVTGSNGKGSTARIASELLSAAGGTVGLFTSPHLYRYNERFRVDGEPVDDAKLLDAMDRVGRAVEDYQTHHDDCIGAFEAQFVIALLVLARCRWLVLEAGIGGRYDPVRLARAPVSALVSLDLEHIELLGKTLVEIAFDKLDATARGGKAILGQSCIPFTEQIRTYADLVGIGVEFVQPDDWRNGGVSDGLQHFDIGAIRDLRSPLVGRHQINNHAVALALVEEKLKHAAGQWPIAGIEDRFRDAVARVSWPGRLETISREPFVVIDVGHTPEGIKAALDGFRALTNNRDAILVTGGSKNKHVREMLEMLTPGFGRIVCSAAHHNGLPAIEVAAMVESIHPQAAVTVSRSIEDAVIHARNEAMRTDAAIYVAGGLFLAIEFAETWRGGDPARLRFF
ncbi:MAG TPA: cyanophycin synthetase [Rhizomicrobium sp.]|nr:cyanophycin synthetase [Rhizomicrobium sp.]